MHMFIQILIYIRKQLITLMKIWMSFCVYFIHFWTFYFCIVITENYIMLYYDCCRYSWCDLLQKQIICLLYYNFDNAILFLIYVYLRTSVLYIAFISTNILFFLFLFCWHCFHLLCMKWKSVNSCFYATFFFTQQILLFFITLLTVYTTV